MNQKDLPKDLPITIDPEIVSGTPVFRGTRVPVQTLFDYLADGYSLKEILDDFPTLNRQDAIRLLEAAPNYLLMLRMSFRAQREISVFAPLRFLAKAARNDSAA